MMKKKIILLMMGCVGVLPLMAQTAKHFTIDGEMTRDSLRYTPQAITKVYLKHIVDGQEVLMDSAVVNNHRFHFEGTAPEYVEAAMVTGFDNGAVQLLLEPGNIKVLPFDAHFPVSAKAVGTENNDVFVGYVNLHAKNAEDSRLSIEKLRASLPDSILKDDVKYYPYHGALFNANGVYYKADVMDYFMHHLNDEASLFILKYDLYYMFKPQVLHDVFMAALPEKFHQHPIYKELENQLLTNQMGEGSPAPDFSALTLDGKKQTLSQLKGKFVFLDIWASWCAPCHREIPFVKQALAEATSSSDKFKVLSYSIDSKRDEWVNCIKKNEMTDKNWIHVSTLKGWGSDIVRLYNVRGVPHTVLIDPNGNIMQFNLRGEELVKTVKEILSKPFKAKKNVVKKDVNASVVMEAFKPASATEKKLAGEYEAIAKRKDLSKIAQLEAKLRFVLDHYDSPVAPYFMERDFLNILDKSYNERLSKSLSPVLKDNPYYKSYLGKVASLTEEEDAEDK